MWRRGVASVKSGRVTLRGLMRVEPKVYLDYTQAELDRAYDQPAWAPNRAELVAWFTAESARVRAARPYLADQRYGELADETLDVFTPERSASGGLAPIQVHIHGGRWALFTKDESSFIAEPLCDAGIACVVPDFSQIPKVRIPEMIEQLRRAIAWVYRNAAGFGADPERIHVSGRSSGAHLACTLALTDWPALGLPRDVIKSLLLVSGSYDMRPVMLSARGNYVHLSDEEVLALSPVLHASRLEMPITLAYGTRETPEVQRHPVALAQALRAAGREVKLMRIEGVNHFECQKLMGDGGSEIGRAMRELTLAS